MQKHTSPIVIGVVAGLAFGIAGLNVSQAQADTQCSGAATLIAPGICELVVTQSGNVSFPTGISKLTAVLVGGGGGSYGYADLSFLIAGGGGEVLYTEALDSSVSQAVTIGSGGQFLVMSGGLTTTNNGTATSVGTSTARPGFGAKNEPVFFDLIADSGKSGSGLSGAFPANHTEFGGGGAKSATSTNNGGAGYKFSEIPSVDHALWPSSSDPAIDPEVGKGGAGPLGSTPLAGSNFGFGGGIAQLNGNPGVVIFRFAPISTQAVADPSLAHTGSSLSTVGSVGIIGAAAGAVLIVNSRVMKLRKRRS